MFATSTVGTDLLTGKNNNLKDTFIARSQRSKHQHVRFDFLFSCVADLDRGLQSKILMGPGCPQALGSRPPDENRSSSSQASQVTVELEATHMSHPHSKEMDARAS